MFDDSVCGDCGQSRDESFDPAMDDKYEVEVAVCHACAARERKAQVRYESRPDGDRGYGEFYIVRPE